jgi:hypothetical protein
MSEHLTDAQIEIYRQQAKERLPAQLLAVDKHLAVCAVCRNRFRENPLSQSTLAVLQTLFSEEGKPEHLTYEQLSGYVKKELDELDAEIVETHAELCRRCAKELRNLQAFATLMATTDKLEEGKEKPSVWWRLLALLGLSPDDSLPQTSSSESPPSTVPLWHPTSAPQAPYSASPQPSKTSWWQTAGAIAMVLLLVSAGFYVWRRLTPAEPTEPLIGTIPQPPGLPNVPENAPTPIPPNVAPPQPSIATFLIGVGARARETQELEFSHQVKRIHLQLIVAGNFPKYKVRLEGGKSADLGTASARQTKNGNVIFLNVPATQLPDGAHRLTLAGLDAQGAEVAAGKYSIRIKRK